MLAPYFSGLLCAQSDFGLPAGAALPTRFASDFPASDFPQNLAVERAGLRTLNEGQTVEYELVTNRGRTSAENLKVA